MNIPNLVCGVGINDADYVVAKKTMVDGKYRQTWVCPIYRTWRCMLERCYSASFQRRRPTYLGCSVCPCWHRFSVFRSWVICQDWADKCLDKDILKPGNKIYEPDSCVFISRGLNNFLTDRASLRGDCPIGVSWSSKSKKFVAGCSNPFNGANEHLGFFSCSNQAHEAWRKRKHQIACLYADMQKDSRIAIALRERFL